MNEVRKLTRQLRITQACLAALVIGAVGIAAAPNDSLRAREIILADPTGGSTVTLRASPQAAGMWIGDKDGKGTVAIYHSQDQGVIGAYGSQDHSKQQLDVCLATGSQGPAFQMSGKDKQVVLTPSNWNPQANNDGTSYRIQFVPADFTNANAAGAERSNQ